jgi:ferredoxin
VSTKKLSKEALEKFVEQLIQNQRVYGVKEVRGERFDYGLLQSAKDLRLDYDVTLIPPKKYFQPTVETLLTFDMEGRYKSVCDNDKFILIGVHPYDMAAINQMDILFSQDNYDSHYMARRNNATIIACDVARPSKDVFAASMGTAVVKEGFDILLTDIGDGFVAQAATQKGEELLAKVTGGIEATDKDLKNRQQVWDKNQNELNKHKLKCKYTDLPSLLEKAYNHPVWEEKARTCFSCGSCNQVCPTCYCFNVQDDVNWDMKTGKRYRAWDGCLLDGFTKVANEHEFRARRADRFRHRMYRKGKYVPAKIASKIPACVGCGRCVRACLPDIANPINVYNRLVNDIGIENL